MLPKCLCVKQQYNEQVKTTSASAVEVARRKSVRPPHCTLKTPARSVRRLLPAFVPISLHPEGPASQHEDSGVQLANPTQKCIAIQVLAIAKYLKPINYRYFPALYRPAIYSVQAIQTYAVVCQCAPGIYWRNARAGGVAARPAPHRNALQWHIFRDARAGAGPTLWCCRLRRKAQPVLKQIRLQMPDRLLTKGVSPLQVPVFPCVAESFCVRMQMSSRREGANNTPTPEVNLCKALPRCGARCGGCRFFAPSAASPTAAPAHAAALQSAHRSRLLFRTAVNVCVSTACRPAGKDSTSLALCIGG